MKIGPGDEPHEQISVLNPADGSIIGEVPAGTRQDADNAVLLAREAFSSWSRTDATNRSKILFTSAERVRADQKELAVLLTREQGKPIRESMNEIAGFARVLEYYASISGSLPGDYGKSSSYGHMVVARQPLGVCAAIIPWNMPALIMAWKIGPVLATGNTMVLKPSKTAPLTCIALAGHLSASGLPEDVLKIVTGTGEVIGKSLATHPDIRSLSFTGSVDTGIRVASLAAPTLKKTILELGGSDAMIVCHDADLKAAAKGAVSGRFFNCGQTCTAIKRVFVHEQIAGSFINEIKELTSRFKIGNGLESGVDMGPLHTRRQRDLVHEIVRNTIDSDMGQVLTGGVLSDAGSLNSGNFYMPTILTDVDPDAPVMKEEVFGPVLPVTTFSTLDEAIDHANATRFGLGSSVWTHDARTISRAIEELNAGIIWVNQHLRIPPEVPFGGMKSSGIGRENGRNALLSYLEEKTILINP
ncbi:aldehyde dehydrogenase family protein [Methanospirillum stamsii]|uniref:Aldehyde dehydrogenase n=1 Tax=Methanospirillum stamsii TaxID=1277351 RepID=A0A2V2N1D7_9EURY|nr:aldehyde dehydrogenase family protein [Methanospirillum stamsii]PWR72385.1 aldehyde dehydrogenase [Methanospirillum stamsii]